MFGENNLNKKIIVTGSDGFIGRNLCVYLSENGYNNITKIDKNTNIDEIKKNFFNADFIFYFAGVNRPKDNIDFERQNVAALENFLRCLKENNCKAPIMFSSSTQAELNNEYGKSKLKAEILLKEYSNVNNIPVYIYRFPNVFGKWCKPNYNSVVATFCNNIANSLQIKINDASAKLSLIYIDDLCEKLVKLLEYGIMEMPIIYNTTVGALVEKIYTYKNEKNNLYLPSLEPFDKCLYSTYLSYVNPNDLSYKLFEHKDDRGSFTEIFKSLSYGQISVNIIKPGVTKGGHFHNTKIEKFLVLSGKANVEYIPIDNSYGKNKTFYLTDKKLEVLNVPPGYIHSITNVGKNDLVMLIWCNEIFNPDKDDTHVI